MLDPFTYWSRMMAVSFDMAQTALRASQTMSASRDVIDKRTDMLRSAMSDPVHADHAELGRMVPEKLAAFSSAGNAMIDGWLAWNRALMEETRHVGAMAMRGRAPTASEWMALAARGQAFGLTAAESSARVGAATLKPVHAKAVSNAKRLSRRKAG
ncbi:MAG: hypothetical protein B7Y45_03295 [Sphingomonas sp. 28-66-16]|nr:MAG: hypothetical protein B7Y45_03295 [Sphingomonas sp. 28-66-16]